MSQILYHGSKSGIVGPIAPTSRSCCDFGRGFYMGDSAFQPQTLICRMEHPVLYTLSVDTEGGAVKLTSRQLLLCELQARLFEGLDRRRVDAKPFIRAFMNSRAAEGLDAEYDRMQWAGEEYIFQDVMEEANLKVDPACARYNVEALFYAGWIYRYWHYKTGESSCEIYRQANETEILQSYGLHIEANDLAVDDLKNAARNRPLEVAQR